MDSFSVSEFIISSWEQRFTGSNDRVWGLFQVHTGFLPSPLSHLLRPHPVCMTLTLSGLNCPCSDRLFVHFNTPPLPLPPPPTPPFCQLLPQLFLPFSSSCPSFSPSSTVSFHVHKHRRYLSRFVCLCWRSGKGTWMRGRRKKKKKHFKMCVCVRAAQYIYTRDVKHVARGPKLPTGRFRTLVINGDKWLRWIDN